MDFAIAAENFAVAIDQDRTVEPPAGRCQFGITDIEADAERPGAIEQGLHGWIRHPTLEAMIECVAFDEPTWKEGRERQVGKNDPCRAACSRLLQHCQHPAKRMLPRVRFLRRPHLSGGGAENSNQHCLHSARTAYARGG